MRKKLPYLIVLGTLVLAGTSGYLTASAVGQGSVKTVTINVATGPRGPQGPQGPAGPQGPPGPPGSSSCASGFSPGNLVINHPGGQTTIRTCIKD